MSNQSLSDSSRQLLNALVLDLRAEQRECWQRGERVFIENLLEAYSTVRSHDESMLELLYSEFCLRDEMGDRPEPEDYFRRFPQYSPRLARLFEMHQALDEFEPEAFLEYETPADSGKTLILTRIGIPPEEWSWGFTDAPQTLGRSPSAEIRLVHQSMSKQHCRFWKDAAGCQIEDCGSTNGTFVNNERIGRRVLAAGDRIRVGGFELLVQEKEDSSHFSQVK